MTLPTKSDQHVNAPLTDLSVQYAQSLDKFAADRLAPVHATDKESGLFFKFTKDYWGRDEMKVRGPGAEAVEAGYGVTTDSYACIPYAVKKMIPDQIRANADEVLDQDRNAMQFLTRLERIKREKAFVAACMAASKWSTDKTGVAAAPGAGQFLQWNDAASTPVENIRAYCTEIEKLTLGAARPNAMGVAQPVWDALADHPDIVDRLKYGGQLQGSLAKVTPAMVAALLDLDEVIVMGAVENTAIEGATFAGSYIAGKGAVLLHRNPARGVEVITGVKTFTWRRYLGNDLGWRLKTYRDENRESDVVEMQAAFTHKIVAPDAGAYLASVVA